MPAILERNNRLLIVDDNPSIHEDFQKVLGASASGAGTMAEESVLFGAIAMTAPDFVLTTARRGEEAIALTRAAVAAGEPFAVAFLDIRMPPGIDGIETARRLWELDPELQIVICSAYSDYAWAEMVKLLGAPERWVLLKKPFENIEVLQLAASLTQKRTLQQIANARQADLAGLVAERTGRLTTALARLEQEITERARAEEERRELERKLEQAQRLESLGVLAGGIAHDFNNILSGVLGRASLARAQAPASDVDEHLCVIELCARRAAELCEQMLAYAGQGRVVVSEIDVNGLVQEIDGLVHASVPRDVDFRIDLAPLASPVRGDAARLRQVVMNLVINGAEALRSEPRRLQLSTRACRLSADEIARLTFRGESKPGEYVVVEVSDTGMGMSAQTIQRMFEPFFSTKFEGRGLGLSAVHGIVRSHGGALDVESEPGRGSTFRVYLPVIDAIVAPSSSPEQIRPPVNKAEGRLLVVDDEECVRDLTAAVLRQRGYQVEVACDGLAGLECVRRDPRAFDGVVLDLTMPRMSGLAALEAMRELRPALPAVLISGYGQQQDIDRLAEGPLTVALQKPFEIDQLCASVALVLNPSQPTDADRNVATST